ncbi:MAG: phospho-N-acetylmuramoyl-pentapeptide-transferase [Clostridia bacterium]|nr:phospho-N-acetylmuramoyl-pentapeptide-transferase [Clostridia bacterium]
MELWAAILMGAAIAFAVAFGLGFVVIPWLHKLKFGQTILDIGPSWHKKKQGTPTMGGILIIAGFGVALAAVLITDKIRGGDLVAEGNGISPDSLRVKVYAGILMALAFTFIGFVDDYIKVVKKRNLGLTELQKTVMQILVMASYMFTLWHFAGVRGMFIPYVGYVESGILFWGVGMVALYATVNAVNFTDGVDGLCASVTATAAVGLSVVAILRGFLGVSVVSACLFGALAGYLIWNWNPSKVIMGDLGSFFLGGMVCALTFALDAPWLILLVGVIYVAEFGSDLLQIAYIKTHNGKKLFRMAPIHHHYEMGGWSEKRICVVFSLVTALGCAAAVALTYFGAPV